MARVQLYQPTDFHNLDFWFGEVERADASRIVISDGSLQAIYKGSFYYDVWGEPYGILTGYEVSYRDTLLGVVQGISVNANDAFELIEFGDAFGLLNVTLRGADTILGSRFPDTLDGFAGNDRIFGGGGNDTLWGDVGSDYIVGGAGVDTAVFLGIRSDYVVTSFGGKIGVSGLGAEFGSDIVVGVERLSFWDIDIAPPKQSFSALEYIASYRDLIRALGDDAELGFSHYIKYGVYEDRVATFDSLEYIASHRDLINAFGANAESGAEHYINYGVREGRSADLFDAEQYLENYADLQAAFGENTEAATRHYIRYGVNEGRTDDALPSFGADDFLF